VTEITRKSDLALTCRRQHRFGTRSRRFKSSLPDQLFPTTYVASADTTASDCLPTRQLAAGLGRKTHLHGFHFAIVANRQGFGGDQAESLVVRDFLQGDEICMRLDFLSHLLFQFRKGELSFKFDSQ